MTIKNQMEVNRQSVTYEIIEDEVIIIHLEKGHYYSLRGVAAEIWIAIDRGLPKRGIVEEFLANYTGTRKDIAIAVENFISELEKEGLILPADSTFIDLQETFSSEASFLSHSEKPLFENPMMEKYTDLEELLLLDPVHEVDESGWPNKLLKEQE